jgi:hypothetical protein
MNTVATDEHRPLRKYRKYATYTDAEDLISIRCVRPGNNKRI